MTKLPPIPKGKIIKGESIVKYEDSRFLSSSHIKGKTPTLTIDRTEYLENFTFGNGKVEEKLRLIYFKETALPLALNKTNRLKLETLFNSSDPGDWETKKIVLHVEKVKGRGGKLIDGIRIKGLG